MGKTTTAVNLAKSFAGRKYKTLLIDNDPQANATSHFGYDPKKIKKGIYECIMENINPQEAIRKTQIQNLYLLPSNLELVGAEIELINRPEREYKMKNVMEKFKNDYDFIIIDCSPSLGLVTINGLVSADTALIPVQCENFEMDGMIKLLNKIKTIKENLNRNLEVEGIFFTMFDPHLNLSAQVAEKLKSQYKNLVLETVIERGAPDILTMQYTNLAKEISRKNKPLSNS